MKKIQIYIVGLVTLFAAFLSSGCALIKDGETISWNKVNIAASALKAVAQTSTYAVCYKNKDLAPIFKAVGEGLVIFSGSAQNSDQFEPEQLEAYINNALAEYGSLGSQVSGIMKTVIECYTNFYNENKDKFKDEVIVFSVMIKAAGEGFILGSDITDTTKVSANATAALDAWNSLDLNVSATK